MQFFRALREAGFLMPFLALFFTIALWVPMLERYLQAPTIAVALLSIAALTWRHFVRQDGGFLFKISKNPSLLLLSEYALLGFVLGLPFLFNGRFTAFFAAFTGLLLAFLPLKKRNTKHKMDLSAILRLPPAFFEYQTVLRKQPFLIFLLVLFSLLTAFHIGFFIGFLLLIAMVLPPVFEYNESRVLVPQTWSALVQKNKKLLGGCLLLCLPSLLLGLVFHTTWWPLFAYGLFSIVVLFQLYFWHKYNAWTPYQESNANASISMIGFFSLLLPGFILIGAALALRYFFSCKNMFHYARH